MLSIIRANCDNLNNRVHRPLMTLRTQVKHGRNRHVIPSVILLRDGALSHRSSFCTSVLIFFHEQELSSASLVGHIGFLSQLSTIQISDIILSFIYQFVDHRRFYFLVLPYIILADLPNPSKFSWIAKQFFIRKTIIF